MKVPYTSEGPVCNRCYQEKGNNRFLASNNMDLGPQPEDLENLTQVDEILIACVSPILQVTHATSGQFKLPIIIVWRRDQHGTQYNFTVERDRVYKALKYKVEHDKFYSDVQIMKMLSMICLEIEMKMLFIDWI